MTIGHHIIGSGKSGVIVLHGWFGDHSVFEPMFPYLDTATFSYAFINYRGYGLSRNIPGAHTMDEIAADAIDLADYLGWQRTHMVGHSMGGMALMRVATSHRDRLKSGVAVTPVPPCGVPLDEESSALFGGAADNDENRRSILDFTTGGRLSGQWLDWKVRRSRETTTRDAYADYLEAWTKTDFAEESKGNDLPLLVCPGEFDGALTAEVMRQTYLDWYPNATLEVLPNSGHYPMQETPVEYAHVWRHCKKAHR